MVSIFCEYLVLFLLDMSLALSLNPFFGGFPSHLPPQSSWFLPPALLSCASFLLLLLLYKSCAPSLGQVDRSHLSGYHAVCECLCGLSFGFQLILWCCLSFCVLAVLVLTLWSCFQSLFVLCKWNCMYSGTLRTKALYFRDLSRWLFC